MKKSVVLAIGVIYVLAIVIVGLIGIKMHIYDAIVYVNEIVCESDDYNAYDVDDEAYKQGYSGYIQCEYSANVKVLVKCKYLPENANAFNGSTPFHYSYDTTSTIYTVTVNGDGTCTVEFLKEGACELIINAQDNNHATLKIKIIAMPNDDDLCTKYGFC